MPNIKTLENVARKLIKLNNSNEDIVEATGLTIEQIEKPRAEQ